MVLSRRSVLAMGLFGTVSPVLPAQAQSRGAAAGPLGHLGLDAGQFGLRPGAAEDQSYAAHDLGKFVVAFAPFPFQECSPWMVRYCTKILPTLDAAIGYIRDNFITSHVD